jgi:hypothetical protein
LLNEVIIPQPVFELIDRAACLSREFFESPPNEPGTSNRIALNPRFAALAAVQTRKLFAFAVQWLDFPADATPLLGDLRGIGSRIVGPNPIRAVGRPLNPETLHGVVFRKPCELARLAVAQCVRIPCERIHALIGALAARILARPIGCERAGVKLLQRLDAAHQVFGRLPRVPQHRLTRQLFLIQQGGEHRTDGIPLAGAVPIGVIEPLGNPPALVAVGVDIDAGDDADAFDDLWGIATGLRPHPCNGKRVGLVPHRVIKPPRATRRAADWAPAILPAQPWGTLLPAPVAIDGIMRALLAGVSKVRQRVVDLTDQQRLARSEASNLCFHTR